MRLETVVIAWKYTKKDFTMRIRLINYNSLFAYYYFSSNIFQFLIYTHKKGLGNNTNIFPSQVQEFPLLDFTLTRQDEMIQKIELQLKKQKEIENQIQQKQQQISETIAKAIYL